MAYRKAFLPHTPGRLGHSVPKSSNNIEFIFAGAGCLRKTIVETISIEARHLSHKIIDNRQEFVWLDAFWCTKLVTGQRQENKQTEACFPRELLKSETDAEMSSKYRTERTNKDDYYCSTTQEGLSLSLSNGYGKFIC